MNNHKKADVKTASSILYRRMRSSIFYAIIPLGLFLPAGSASAAGNPGAVSAVDESEDTIDSIQNEAQSVTDRKNNEAALQSTQKDLQQTELDITSTQSSLADNSVNITQGQADLTAIQKNLQTAVQQEDTAYDNFLKAYAKALSAVDEATALQTELIRYQAEYEAAVSYENHINSISSVSSNNTTAIAGRAEEGNGSVPSEIEAKLKEYNYDENYLDTINKQLYGGQSQADSGSTVQDESEENDAVQEQAAADAASRTAQAESELENAQGRMDELQDIIAASDDAKTDWDDAQKDVAELTKDESEQNEYLAALLQDQHELTGYLTEYIENRKNLADDIFSIKELLNPYQNYSSLQTSAKFYTWHDGTGHKGKQYINRTDYSAAIGKFEFGLSGGTFRSNNESSNNGSAGGLLDTDLHMGIRNFSEINQVTYNMDINIPTGKNNLRSTTAMSTDLVPYDRFGDGWQITPSIRVKHKVNDINYILYGGGINFKGSYNYNNTSINPGTEFTGNIGWLHAAEGEQFLSQMFFNKSARSQDGDLSYRDGSSIEWRNTYNKQLTKNYNWPSYVWLAYSAKPDYYDDTTASGSQTRIFYGTGIEKKLSAKEKLRLMFHGMHSIGSDYDPVTQLAFSGRDRYSLKLSYNKILNDKNSYSVSLEDFYMKDSGNSTQSYKGINLMFSYNRNF
ncbi:hypothetical protein NXG61_00325 [Pectinatus haikarae]